MIRNTLYLYNATQTYTETVYEHLASFARHSRHRSFFAHHDQTTVGHLDLARFDAVAIHYSIRLPYDQISSSAKTALSEFTGLKVLFIQDEYDHTHRAWDWIKALGIHLVFTVVPEPFVERVYPPHEFPATRFLSVLTGYVPDHLPLHTNVVAPSERHLIVGYRGRPLPIRYGQLGVDKVRIGQLFKAYCDAHAIASDIAWSEEARIYGPRWYEFMASCRSMLGSESGSNVFDWDGSLAQRIVEWRHRHPQARDEDIYETFVREMDMDGVMNQISPRVFEAIAAKTVLVLFEGHYSGIIRAGEHFIPVKKDGSNLRDVMRLLQDGAYVDAMAERAYRDVIESAEYSYRSFVRKVDDAIEGSIADARLAHADGPGPASQGIGRAHVPISSATLSRRTRSPEPAALTTAPIRAQPLVPASLARRAFKYVTPASLRRRLAAMVERRAVNTE